MGNNDNKKANVDAWSTIKFFKPVDFGCKCKGLCQRSGKVSMDLVKKLDAIREGLGLPMQITSGVRCERYNQQVVKSSPTSPHVPDPNTGQSYAVDVYAPNAAFAYNLIALAIKQGIPHIGLGSASERGQYYVHLDIAPRPEEVKLWVYPSRGGR